MIANDERVLARVTGGFSFFRSRHDIKLSDNRLYHFWCEKIWAGVFACERGEERYRLYRHKGLNYSIFQNDSQIASVSRNKVKIGRGDNYEILINDGANFLVVVCMVLTMDVDENDIDTSSVTYDFGNVGPEGRPFDSRWQPS